MAGRSFMNSFLARFGSSRAEAPDAVAIEELPEPELRPAPAGPTPIPYPNTGMAPKPAPQPEPEHVPFDPTDIPDGSSNTVSVSEAAVLDDQPSPTSFDEADALFGRRTEIPKEVVAAPSGGEEEEWPQEIIAPNNVDGGPVAAAGVMAPEVGLPEGPEEEELPQTIVAPNNVVGVPVGHGELLAAEAFDDLDDDLILADLADGSVHEQLRVNAQFVVDDLHDLDGLDDLDDLDDFDGAD